MTFIIDKVENYFCFSNIQDFRKEMVDWKKRQEKITDYCNSNKSVKLKKNSLVTEKSFQKKLVENIVHVGSLNLNWCLGKSCKEKLELVIM